MRAVLIITGLIRAFLQKDDAMLFVIIGHDGPGGAALRSRLRTAHLANLRPLDRAGKVKLAGPFTDGSGSLIIVDMESEAEAIAFANSDPYTTAGVFERAEVKPCRQVFRNERNGTLTYRPRCGGLPCACGTSRKITGEVLDMES